MLYREEKRLRALFRSLLLVSVGAPAAMVAACSSSSSGDGTSPTEAGAGDTGADGTLQPDGNRGGDTGAGGGDGAPGDDGGGDGGAVTDAPTGDGRVPLCDPDAAHPQVDGRQYLEAGDDGGCDLFFEYTGCAPYDVAKTGSGCYFNLAQCSSICGFSTSAGCFVVRPNCTQGTSNNYILDASSVIVNCTKCLGGRRPEGMPAAATQESGGGGGGGGDGAGALGAWFANLAHLEGASIAAFRTLRAELAAHGAPHELVRMAERAARDEVRHTRATARLARRFGGAPKLPKVLRGSLRSLEALAIENAAEGCVRETFGALLARHQAEHAADAEVRAEMARIADDETRHAALAWAVAHWAEGQLDEGARARVRAAREEAVRELRRDAAHPTPAALTETAGLPSARVATALLDGAARALWS